MSKLLRCMTNAEFFCYVGILLLCCTGMPILNEIYSRISCITQLNHASFAKFHKCLDTSAINQYPGLGGVWGISFLGAIRPLLHLPRVESHGLHLLLSTVYRGQVVDPGWKCHLELWAYVHLSIKNLFTGWEHIPYQGPNQIEHYWYLEDIIPRTCIFWWWDLHSSKLGFKIGCQYAMKRMRLDQTMLQDVSSRCCTKYTS